MIARIFFTLLFIVLGPRAWAQTVTPVPPAMPAQLGSTGGPFKIGQAEEGRWLAWRYTINGATHIYVLCAEPAYEVVAPDTTGFTPIRTARAYWSANVTFDCKDHPTMRWLVLDAVRAFRQ